MTTIERTLIELREQNVIADVAQQWVSFGARGGVRRDLFGIVDVVALYGTLTGIQCCVADRFADHKKLITETRALEARAWLQAGGALEIWSWWKRKVKRGGKQEVWTYKVVRISEKDLAAAPTTENDSKPQGD